MRSGKERVSGNNDGPETVRGGCKEGNSEYHTGEKTLKVAGGITAARINQGISGSLT